MTAAWPSISVVIPALNEEAAIGAVVASLPPIVSTIVVADNGSTDGTAERARAAGAVVVAEPRRGYGRACLAGLRAIGSPEVVVFLDADLSDYPEELTRLVEPIAAGNADFVLGARDGAGRPAHARIGTSFCVAMINLLWRTGYTDLGPFRAIRRTSLERLAMRDQTWGWTIEMQVKAAEAGLRILEIPIRQRARIGTSKISGSLAGSARAAGRMFATIWSLWRTRKVRCAADA